MTKSLAFEPVILDCADEESHSVLVKRDGRLLGVVSCLGDHHVELKGRWYVEILFNEDLALPSCTFEDLEAFEQWYADGG